MAERRSLNSIYREAASTGNSGISMGRCPHVDASGSLPALGAPLIVLLALHAGPVAFKIPAGALYVSVGLWAGVTSGRMAKAESNGSVGRREPEILSRARRT